MMENSKELEFPEGQEGVRGLESASRILMTRGSLYAYLIYILFLDKVKKLFHLGVNLKRATINAVDVNSLSELNNGLGDLTWSQNLGDQVLSSKNDTFFVSNEINALYTIYEFKENDRIRLMRFQSNQLLDETDINIGEKMDWIVISKYILYKKNDCYPNCRILIFYNSFLLSTMSLYLELTSDVYMFKSTFNKSLVEHLNPDYVFEFRVERFLF